MSLLLPNAYQQFCDGTGTPLAGGFVYTYEVGTTTPVTTYQDYLLTIPNSNPIVLDGNGRCQIWGVGAFQQLVTDQYGNQIWSGVTSDGSIDPGEQFAPISGSPYYAPATGSPNYAPISGSTFYASINGNASNTFLVNASTAADMAPQTGQVQSNSFNYSLDTGTVNAVVATLSPPITDGYSDGEIVAVRIANTNTGASTLNVNSIGAGAIQYTSGAALQGGELAVGRTAVFIWNASASAWQLLNPLASTAGTVEYGLGTTGTSWQNFTATRSLNNAFTNSTGSPIAVKATITWGYAGGYFHTSGAGFVNGAQLVNLNTLGNGTQIETIDLIVPPGATYQINAGNGTGSSYALNSWYELAPNPT